MEGSIRQAGAKVRIAVQLVDAGSGAGLWAETCGRASTPEATLARTIQLRHVFQVQQQLPHALGDQLFQLEAQEVAVNAVCRFSLKVQNRDTSGFPN